MHYYKQTRYKLLRTFCVVAQKENITHAAEQLHISQPTVSLQIQALEREMGEKLLERRGPSVKLTPEGKTLYQLIQPLTAGIDSLRETFAASLGKIEEGEINISAGQSTSLYILPEYIERFHNAYPSIRINLHNNSMPAGLKPLLDDQVDFAVGSLPQVPENVLYRPFVSFKSILITSLDHPLAHKAQVTLDDISPYGMILPPSNVPTWHMIDTVFRQHNLPYKVVMEAGGWEVVKRYVSQNVGISITTEVCITGKENLAVMPVDDYFPPRTYGLIMRRGKFFTPQAKRFLEMFDPALFENEGL
jgi:DNA-binding transcriptional LysR family regulator